MASDTSTTKWAHQHCLVRVFFINRLEITFHAKDNMSCMLPTLWRREGRWVMSPAERVELCLLWDSLNCQIKSVSKWALEASFLGRYAIDWTRPEWSFFWEEKISALPWEWDLAQIMVLSEHKWGSGLIHRVCDPAAPWDVMLQVPHSPWWAGAIGGCQKLWPSVIAAVQTPSVANF